MNRTEVFTPSSTASEKFQAAWGLSPDALKIDLGSLRMPSLKGGTSLGHTHS
jgi:hypothetical protein